MYARHWIAETEPYLHCDLYLTLKAPITTATEDKFSDIYPNFQEIRYDIS